MLYYSPAAQITKAEVDSVLADIDASMSLYKPNSLISTFNNPATDAIQMDGHMEQVMRRAMQVHKQSNGLFDVTVRPLVGLWGFSAEGVRTYPTKQTIDSVLTFVGMDNLTVKGKKLKKTKPNISIDLDGIAQGYSVDALAHFFDKKGIRSYLIEIGGEIKTRGAKEGGKAFQIAIERPENADKSSFVLNLKDRAVTTSGNYRKAFDFEGNKIHHHISPTTGYPLQNDVASVTVIAKTAIDADAYDNVFMALSPAESLRLANKLPGVEVYIITKTAAGFEEHFSKGFKRYMAAGTES